MYIKICGTTNLEDAELAVRAGADALGFIFAPSKRRVTVAGAAAITAYLPGGLERVGVFTDASFHEIAHAVQAAGLTAVQLHRGYDQTLIERLNAAFGSALQLWQVVSYEIDAQELNAQGMNAQDASGAEHGFVQTLGSTLRDQHLAVVLLDTAKSGATGGLGESFPWRRVAGLLQSARSEARDIAESSDDVDLLPRLVVAGGLTAENVAEAIQTLKPWGVDCVSGVEAEPGRKDRDRLSAFITAARGGC